MVTAELERSQRIRSLATEKAGMEQPQASRPLKKKPVADLTWERKRRANTKDGPTKHFDFFLLIHATSFYLFFLQKENIHSKLSIGENTTNVFGVFGGEAKRPAGVWFCDRYKSIGSAPCIVVRVL